MLDARRQAGAAASAAPVCGRPRGVAFNRYEGMDQQGMRLIALP